MIGTDGPASADRCEAGDGSEGDGHASEEGKTALAERVIGAGKDKREDREDARAEDGEDSAEIRQKKQKHSA